MTSLAHLRVLDLSRVLAGPWASQMLAEFGAEVIKVEPPGGGDPSRANHPRFRKHSVYFNIVNGCKRSLMLDLAQPAGREATFRRGKSCGRGRSGEARRPRRAGRYGRSG